MTGLKLMKVSYYDADAEIRLDCYADTVVYAKEGVRSMLAAIRLSGYPESVKGITEAIFGGGSITIEIGEQGFIFFSKVKQYHKEYSHDGLYAEALLQIKDENQQRTDGNSEKESTGDGNKSADAPRKCYIFCAAGDSEQLFEEVDKKTAVPLIPHRYVKLHITQVM